MVRVVDSKRDTRKTTTGSEVQKLEVGSWRLEVLCDLVEESCQHQRVDKVFSDDAFFISDG